MNTRSKGFLILLAILLLAVPTIGTLVTPTTYHKGALIYAEFWDFHGEVGARNGSMENVSIENATNVNSSNLNISSKFYVNTSGAIYQGTYNGSPILQDYLDARLLKDSNSSILLDTNKTILTDRNASILVKQRVDSCTGTSDALGWNGTGFDCRTISTVDKLGNNSMEVTYSNTSRHFNASTFQNTTLNPAILKKYNLYYMYNRTVNGSVNLSWVQYRSASTTGKTYTVLKQNGVNASAVFDTPADDNIYGFSAIVYVNSTTPQTIELWGWRTTNSHIVLSGVDIKFDHVEEQQKETTGIWNP